MEPDGHSGKRTCRDTKADGQAGKRTDRKTDTETDGQTGRGTDRQQAQRQTDRCAFWRTLIDS